MINRTKFFKHLMFYSNRIRHFVFLTVIIGVLLFILEYINDANYYSLLIISVSGIILSIHYFLSAFVPGIADYDLSIVFPELIDDEIYDLKKEKANIELKIKELENEILDRYRKLNTKK